MKIKQFLLGLVCRFKGHQYASIEFNTWSLCFCQRCGKELAGRTISDIDERPGLRYGDGSGTGYGSGHGYGDGDGSGSGSGYGDGDGSGYGYG